MASQQSAGPTTAVESAAFERFAGLGGILTGVSSLLYAVFFLLVTGMLHTYLPPILLAIGGFFATVVLTAVYARVRAADPIFALWALALGVLGQLGAAIHGTYALASVIDGVPTSAAPNPVDPAGFLAFGIAGLGTFILSWLILRGGQLPRGLGTLGCILAVALVALFLGALFTNNDTKSLFVLIPGAVASLIATPTWYLWLAQTFLRAPAW